MGVLRSSLRLAQRLVPASNATGTWVLAYHLVEGGTDSVVDLPLGEFLRQLDELAGDSFEVVPLSEVFGQNTGPGPTRVVLTFDDAFANFVDVVLPLLQERGLASTLFVPTAFVDGELASPLAGAALRSCSWDELRAASAAGVEIGSHTVTHRNFRRLGTADVRFELKESRARLEHELGTVVQSFCYPKAKWTLQTRRIVSQQYRRAVVGGGRPVGHSDSALSIPRLPIRRSGPPLTEMLRQRVWLEEAVAARARQLRP